MSPWPWLRRRREESPAAPPSVETVLRAQPYDHLAEIALYFDPVTRLWHAYPLGTPWATCDAPPTATGSDPLAVIRALLAAPAQEVPSC